MRGREDATPQGSQRSGQRHLRSLALRKVAPSRAPMRVGRPVMEAEFQYRAQYLVMDTLPSQASFVSLFPP